MADLEYRLLCFAPLNSQALVRVNSKLDLSMPRYFVFWLIL